ncbi:1364_t:CDS:2 [Paraglomus occultum]|uniref:Peptide hydrolase n=1 Tax=Paraglomus occultum TaxID=144539 RepID=A0A9N9BTU0_9GLOM|nr:1364_t:CDS:2 [Paraglomus occultum]
MPSENTPLFGENASAHNDNESSRKSSVPYGLIALFLFIFLIIALISMAPHDFYESSPEDIISPGQLTRNVFAHLKAFDQIAKSGASVKHNGHGSRSVLNSYNKSAEYVVSQLEKTKCETERMYFKVPVWNKVKEAAMNVSLNTTPTGKDVKNTIALQGGIDFWSTYDDFDLFVYDMRDGGVATMVENAAVVEIPHYGCQEVKEWKHVKGKVALISNGGKCTYFKAAYRAENEGAVAVIFYNTPEDQELIYTRVRKYAWSEGDPTIRIPVLSSTYTVGQLLRNEHSARISIRTYSTLTIATTYNVICRWGEASSYDNTIVLGAHLDSVPDGPGLVDNASGSAVLLEILLALERAHFVSKNYLIFAWWGAEELGQLGSRMFVKKLLETGEIDSVAMNLNFDMLGSPNYVPFIHRGTDAPLEVQNASIKIQKTFIEYFSAARRPYEIIDMKAGSDFLPFLENGIPSGGILTGAGAKKTEEQRRIFGGFANAAYDTCYHQSCDDVENVNEDAIMITSSAALHTIIRFAQQPHLRRFLDIAV